jgi:hypothetical protein
MDNLSRKVRLLRLSLYVLNALICSSLRGGVIDFSSFTNSATIITFDDLTGGNCNLCGPSVTNQYASRGVVFNNPSFPGQDTADMNLTSGIPNSSPSNALFVDQGGHLGETSAMPFQILFSVPVATVGFDYGSSLDSFLCIAVYGTNDTLLETLTYVGTPTWLGLGGFAGIHESTPITRLDISYHPNYDSSRTFNFSIDELSFEGYSAPESPTELLVAIGLFSIVLRHRKPIVFGFTKTRKRPPS